MMLFLVGLPGVGKTFQGQRLANHLQIEFTDLDVEIESNEVTSIDEIIKSSGEDYFREVESQCLRNLVAKSRGSNLIIATGGGTPCFNNNMAFMKSSGLVMYIVDSAENIAHRIVKNAEINRPLLHWTNESEIVEGLNHLLQKRLQFYQQSHMHTAVSSMHDLHLFTKRLELFTG